MIGTIVIPEKGEPVRRRRPRLPLIAAALALLLVPGCTVAGSPVRSGPDPAAVDIGPYRAELLAPPRDGTDAEGRVLESVRMGEAVIDPLEADPALKFGLGAVASVPVPTPAKAAFLARPVQAVLERHGMLAGFSVGGMDTEIAADLAVGRARLLTVLLLRFPDPAAARSAAAEIDAVDAAVSPENVPAQIPGHPGAHAHWRPSTPTLAATTAEDSYVISVLAGERTTDLDGLGRLAAAAFTAQTARLRDFRPTPPDRFGTLPLDTDGMLARLLPEAPGVWPRPQVVVSRSDANAGWQPRYVVTGVVYGPRASHRYGSWEKSAEPGNMVIALNGLSTLVRLPDAAAARREYDESVGELTEPGQREVAAPAGIPDSRCMESLSGFVSVPRFACRVLYGAHEGLAFARTLDDAHHKIAAQYLLLARSE
ncbi:hypothetical protein BJY24_005493 [Nocardia transvalensis]|uniref:Uncharacterized protein n=1 Tax=Nocardia transvalensis TaxID=37333 RepID=A0A7W9PI83_9NOCA|nr:hypothetical protein [Nocardia transvalensis]MBB5916581.1 hypothetical protein [Nocardia transvalensis]